MSKGNLRWLTSSPPWPSTFTWYDVMLIGHLMVAFNITTMNKYSQFLSLMCVYPLCFSTLPSSNSTRLSTSSGMKYPKPLIKCESRI